MSVMPSSASFLMRAFSPGITLEASMPDWLSVPINAAASSVLMPAFFSTGP